MRGPRREKSLFNPLLAYDGRSIETLVQPEACRRYCRAGTRDSSLSPTYQEGGEDCPGDAAGGGTDRLFSSP
jgi:hypothetical protein